MFIDEFAEWTETHYPGFQIDLVRKAIEKAGVMGLSPESIWV